MHGFQNAPCSKGKTSVEVVYLITILPPGQDAPHSLLALIRGHWSIKNCLHYRRDMTLREDHSQLRMGHAPHLLAILNNTAVGLVARQGSANLAEARRELAYQIERAFSSPAA